MYANIILTLLIAGGLAVWAGIAGRRLQGSPVVPWEPRRPVPWQGFHVLVLVLLYAGLQICVPAMLIAAAEPATKAARDSEETDAQHLVGRLLRDSQSPSVVMICLASAGVAAPFSEEFLFRLLVQGWLEKKDRRLRRRRWVLRRLMPGVIPVVLVAMAFAGIHFRIAEPQVDVSLGARIMLGSALANLVTMIVGVVWLRGDTRATAADLGFVTEKLWPDVRTGLLAYVAIAPILFTLQAGLSWLLPSRIAPDPFSLLPFALLVGFLYYRTHRLVPSIVVHMGLNGTSLLVAWIEATLAR